MRIALAQLNPTVGDLNSNLKKLQLSLAETSSVRTDLIILPELFLCGYPPRDLLDRSSFINQCASALEDLKKISTLYPKTAILVGTITRCQLTHGKKLHNSAVLIENGRTLFTQHKSLLPAYDVFDENRYFEPGHNILAFPFRDEVLGISICEDAWNVIEGPLPHLYEQDPLAQLSQAGATLIINLSASPYYLGKEKLRLEILARQSQRLKLPLLMVNQVGANDELIFDGDSLALNFEGKVAAEAAQFSEEILYIKTDKLKPVKFKSENVKQQRKSEPTTPSLIASLSSTPNPMAQLEKALVLGISDYFNKCGFKQTVIGLSGGVDSALTCALAVKALGSDNVWGITMPSPYSSGGSVEDSRILAENLGIRFDIMPISSIYKNYLDTLEPLFNKRPMDLAEENIQARIRGNLLMAIANKFGRLLLATGNKSEMAIGYCTLYGDMSGSLAPISDLPKGLVYKLSHYINQEKIIIPPATLSKEPSAELRPDQKDQDSLPPYDLLDKVLELYIDAGLDAATIANQEKFPLETVSEIIALVNRNEYKRRQAPPGLKVTSKAFGSGRRMPIAARF